MQLSLSAVLSSLVVFQLLFMAVFLVSSKKGKLLSNRLMGIFFVLLAVNTSDIMFTLFGFGEKLAVMMLLTDVNVYGFGPLIFLYCKSVVYKDFKLTPKVYWHFVPWLFMFLFFALGLIFQGREGVVMQNGIQTTNLPLYIHVIIWMFYVHIGAYLVLSFRDLRIYRKEIKDQFAAVNKINLDWLSFMLKTFAAIGVASFVHALVNSSFSAQYLQFSLAVLIIFELYFINAVVFKALRQPEMFSGISLESRQKYAEASLSDSELDNIKKTLEELMVSQAVFLNPDITVNSLAELLEIHPKKLSQVINRSYNKNFFDFINAYRIEYAQRQLRSTDKTVLEILYEAGFNSKSSFNTAFKKVSGTTPTKFRVDTFNT